MPLTSEALSVQDVDVPGGQTPHYSTMDTKILVDDVPPFKRDEVFIKSYLSDMMNVSCNVKQYGKQFLASFNQPIGIKFCHTLCHYHDYFMCDITLVL